MIHLETARYLLDLRAHVNGDVGESKHKQVYENPLRTATRGGQVEIVELLLGRGADPNFPVGDPLTQAVKHGYLDITRRLLDYGANVNSTSGNT
jgi:ankyrin repeat protein